MPCRRAPTATVARDRLRRSGSRWPGSRPPARRTGRASRPRSTVGVAGSPAAESADAVPSPPLEPCRSPSLTTVAARRQGGTDGGEHVVAGAHRCSSSRPTRRHQERNDSVGRQRQVAGLGPARPGPGQPRQRAATTRHPAAAAEAARRGRRRARPDPSGRHPPSPRPRRAWPPPRPWARCRRGGRRRPSCAGAPGCRGCRSRPGTRRRRPRTASTRRAASRPAGRCPTPLSSGLRMAPIGPG